MGYLSVADSEKLADPALNKYMKLEVLSSRAIAIGLFKPDEKSFKSILGAGVSAGLELASQEKLPMMTELKRMSRSSAKRQSHPTSWMDRYTHVCLETCQTHYEKDMKQILQQGWWGWLPWTYLAARAAPCLVPS